MKIQSTLLAFSGVISLVYALPAVKRDSSENEPAVEAPNGTPITLTEGPTSTSVDDSNSNSYSSNSYGSSSSMMYGNYNTNTVYDSSSTMMYDTTSTTAYQSMYTADATSTWTSSMATATYGSGYTPSGYDSCVQQCMANYAPPPSMVTATPAIPPNVDNGNSGNGATHTVIVAPTQGVLRYVPFAVNATVGDTVRFVWGAGPHTVTQSSQFNLCNATLDHPFKSGLQNKSFVFDQVVNDTNPTFYYCGVPTHCEKGMFGVINPPNAQPGATTSTQSMISTMTQNNSDLAAQWTYTMTGTQNSTAASMWGGNMDLAKMTSDPQGQLALIQNVMFTRLAMASNQQYITPQGGFNPDISQGMSVPVDPTKLVASSNGTSTSSESPMPYGTGTTSSAPAATTSNKSAASRSFTSSATAIFAAAAIAALVL